VLAQLANKTYTGYKRGETDCQYETWLALPDGWKLLTTASNINPNNGYFGAAYWHPEYQQVVIAHRGTDPTNVGALLTAFNGVFRNHFVPQMGSASTFVYKVMEVLQQVSQIKGIIFQMFLTGHSTGGWLAQITTFTSEYLSRNYYKFFKNKNDLDCWHPHTVVFNSPGCKDMLLKVNDRYDVRRNGGSIPLEHLDITSYLSAPNFINTCNRHLGTVYRIFTDLSDMGWWGRVVLFYTKLTLSMDKIVEAFNPETGQVYEDVQGELKIYEVEDWPVNDWYDGWKEYRNFFKWAKPFNDYHPDTRDISLSSIRVRYRCKLYDMSVNSLSVFSEEERKFLESFRLLRKLQDSFKPKQLLCVVKDKQEQEKAENLLESFKIENDKIHCTDASALQALFPYVKRLLQLFPEIKENTKTLFSPDAAGNRSFQNETTRNVERINQSPLEFNCDDSRFSDFVQGEQHRVLQLNVDNADEWTGLIKVFQVLQKNGCVTEGQYTVLKLRRLITSNQLRDLIKLMLSTKTSHLVLMSCEDNKQLEEKTKDIIRTLFDIIKKRPHIKFILLTCSVNDTINFLQEIGREIFDEGFVATGEKLTWSDLTKRSQEKLLQKSVIFQGAKISLNKIMSAESPAVQFLPFAALVEGMELQIADPVPVSNGYNETCYIGRTFRIKRTVKQEIVWDKCSKKILDLLVRTEKDFREISQNNPNYNVHWLQEDKSGKLLWQRSQGSLKNVRAYIDTDSSHTYTDDDLDKLLERAEQQRVMLIADLEGMGKSTVLTHLSKVIKRIFPNKWVARIDLSNHKSVLERLEEGEKNKEKAIEFVSERLLKLKPGLEMELFKLCCEQKQNVRIVIMLDGFHEISQSNQQTVIGLLQALRQTAVEQLWVTTRPHLGNELEDKLQQLSYTLEPFSEQNKVEFLIRFWSLKEWFIGSGNGDKDRETRLEVYVKELCKKLSQSTSDKDKDFTGTPLQCQTLAESFEEEAKALCLSPDTVKPA
jgi:hypothetical protein